MSNVGWKWRGRKRGNGPGEVDVDLPRVRQVRLPGEPVSRNAPSFLRAQPLKQGHIVFTSPKTLAAIKMLAAGKSRLETARAVGLDKANVRVIELRAKRRGYLPGAFKAAAFDTYEAEKKTAAVRMALAGSPHENNCEIARRLGVHPSTVRSNRESMGIRPVGRGRPRKDG